MESESKTKEKYFGIINYRKFCYLPTEEKIKQFINQNIYNLDKSSIRKIRHIYPKSTFDFLLTSKCFYELIFDNKHYSISGDLFDEIQKKLYEIFLIHKDEYINKIENINIRLRKKRSIIDKIEILNTTYNEYINFFNRTDTLDFAQNNNLYLTDKNEYLKSDFNNDELLYDFDYIFYSIVYSNANNIFTYIFKDKWEDGKKNLLDEIFKLYNGKKIINFCDKELEKLESDNNKKSRLEVNSSNNDQFLLNNKIEEKEYISKVFKSEEKESIFHKLLLRENVINEENKPKHRFKTVTYNSFNIMNKLHYKLFNTTSLKTFVEFLEEKYHFKPSDKTKFANKNHKLISSIEDFVRDELEKFESSLSSQNPNKDELSAN